MVRPGRPPLPVAFPAPDPLAEVGPGPVPIPAPAPEPRPDPVVEVPPLPAPLSAPAPVPTPNPPPPGVPWPAASPVAAPVCPMAGTGAELSTFDPGPGAGVRLALGETANCPRASPSGICGAFSGNVGVGLRDTRVCSSVPRVCDGLSFGGSTTLSPDARFGASAFGRIGAGGGVAGSTTL